MSERRVRLDLFVGPDDCQKIFERLTAWLRKQGIKAAHPLHEMRKEFGSLINAEHGIHAASRALRYTDISITNLFYTDARKRALPGLGPLLEEEEEKVMPIQGEPLQIKKETLWPTKILKSEPR